MAMDDELVKSRYVELDVLPHTFVAMNNHISNIPFQSVAFEFLQTLTDKRHDVVGAFRVAGRVDAVATVMDRHRNDTGVSIRAVFLLLHLGMHDATIILELASKGLFTAMVDVLSRHAGSSSPMLSLCANQALMAEAAFYSLRGTNWAHFGAEHMRSPGVCFTSDCNGCLVSSAFLALWAVGRAVSQAEFQP